MESRLALDGRCVVLGVCGGIAAYKAVEVCRRLGRAGAHVVPVLTRSATRFVGAATFNALGGEAAQVSLFPGEAAGAPPGGAPASAVPHVSLGRRADAIVVVPATARLIGSYAAGIASDLLTATLLATKAPVMLCPAMHSEMWEHPAVQQNIDVLKGRGVHVLPPAEGVLAGGDVGPGRLPEPADIVGAVIALFPAPAVQTLAGIKAVVSAGGTREPIDPVRYLANRSSGRQGYAIASELAERGAHVKLVSSAALPPPPGTEVVRVETSSEMAEAVLGEASAADVVVMAAAVADYRPATVSRRKVKKTGSSFLLELVPTTDILAQVAARRRPGQVIAGFAAETASGAELARLGREKLAAKGADLIVANDVGSPGAGFGHERSSAVIVTRGPDIELGLVDKTAVASKLADAITELLRPKAPSGAEQGGHGPRGLVAKKKGAEV